jgi:hypothetical protein
MKQGPPRALKFDRYGVVPVRSLADNHIIADVKQKDKRFPGLNDEMADAITFISPTRLTTPEMKLVAEVMLSALEILEKGDAGGKDDPYAETRRWVIRDTNDWPFDFNPVCDRLGLDPDATRKRLLAWVPTGQRLRVDLTFVGLHGQTQRKVVKAGRTYGKRKSFRYGKVA